jgi:hypothetical protein
LIFVYNRKNPVVYRYACSIEPLNAAAQGGDNHLVQGQENRHDRQKPYR